MKPRTTASPPTMTLTGGAAEGGWVGDEAQPTRAMTQKTPTSLISDLLGTGVRIVPRVLLPAPAAGKSRSFSAPSAHPLRQCFGPALCSDAPIPHHRANRPRA